MFVGGDCSAARMWTTGLGTGSNRRAQRSCSGCDTAATRGGRTLDGQRSQRRRSGRGRSQRNQNRNRERCGSCRPNQAAYLGGSGESGRPKSHRDQLRLDARHRISGHVHAGWFCHGRNRALPCQKRQPHHDDELHGLRFRPVRLLGVWIRHTDGRSSRSLHAGRRQSTQS